MECIKLYYKEELVGVLTYKEPQYIFVKNSNFSNMNLIACIGLKEKIEYYSERLFPFFYRFIPHKDRKDIIDKAGINDADSDYEKLRKVASLDLNKNSFWVEL